MEIFHLQYFFSFGVKYFLFDDHQLNQANMFIDISMKIIEGKKKRRINDTD